MSRPAKLTTASRISRAPGVLSADMQGEMVMMDAAAGRYIGLDGIGTDIWRRIETPRTIDELAAELAQDYAADRDRIADDLAAHFERLAELKLVEID